RAEGDAFSSAPVAGAIEDGELHFALRLSNGDVVDFRGRADGDRIIASLASNGHGGSTVLTLEKPVVTATIDVTGTWSGNVTVAGGLCDNGQPKTWSSSVTLGLLQQQGFVEGSMTVDNKPEYDSQTC